MPQEGRANIQYTSSNFVQAALPLIPLFTSFICHATFAKAKGELRCGDTYNITKFLRSKLFIVARHSVFYGRCCEVFLPQSKSRTYSPSKQIILPPR